MKAQYNPPKIKDGSYEYNSYPYIEVKPTNEHYRMCYCCHRKEMNIHELRLGVNNSTTSICICEECLLIFNDLLNEYTDKLGG